MEKNKVGRPRKAPSKNTNFYIEIENSMKLLKLSEKTGRSMSEILNELIKTKL